MANQILKFSRKSIQGDNDSGSHFNPPRLHFRGRLKNRARLHLENFREGNPESTAAMPEHRIELVQLVYTPRNLLSGDAEFICQLILLGVIVRQKFVKRRIEKPDRGGATLQAHEKFHRSFLFVKKVIR